jgi:hypothetical protein
MALTNTLAKQSIQTNANFNVSLSVSVPAEELHWKNPAGGSFIAASNWDPKRSPAANTITVFGLEGDKANPIPVQAVNNSVGQLFIRRMPGSLYLGCSGSLE